MTRTEAPTLSVPGRQGHLHDVGESFVRLYDWQQLSAESGLPFERHLHSHAESGSLGRPRTGADYEVSDLA